jgi:hypothetical protein
VEQAARGVYNFLLEEELTALDATDLYQAAEDLQRGPITSFFIIANVKNLHPILPVKSTVDALKAQRPALIPPPRLPPQSTSAPPPPQAPIDLPFTSPETNTSSPTIQGTAGGTSGTSSPRTSKATSSTGAKETSKSAGETTSKATSSTPKETSISTKTSTYRKLPSITLPMSALQGRL